MNETVYKQQATVIGLRDLSPTVREITLRPDGGAAVSTAGSHLRVQVQLPGGRVDDRRYSLVGLPAPGADWRIAVKRADPGRGGSAFMWRLAVGDRLPVHGPHNHFELPPAPRPTLLVAGGIGITPLVGMALALAKRRAPLRMAYAARSPDELVYADELRLALGERFATFCRSEGQTMDLEAEFAALAADAQALVCGPVPLLHAARAAWARAGRLPQRLRFETFGNTGSAPAEPFTVQVPRHGLTLEVPADRSLLEVLEGAGVQVLHDCLRGECGLCAVDVLAVNGRIDHRDVFFSEAEQREGHRLCACVSRVCGGGVTIDSAWRPDELSAAA